MGKRKGIIALNYNLKDKSEETTLVYVIGYHRKKRFKVSTKQSVYVATWNHEKQRCEISTLYADRVNRHSRKVNKFLNALDKGIVEYFKKYSFNEDNPNYYGSPEYLKASLQRIIDDIIEGEKKEEEKKSITPLQFFQSYVDNMNRRVVMNTGRYTSDRTIGHHKTVLKRWKEFFKAKFIKDDFSVFDNKFEKEFMDWAFSCKNYSYNTIPASFSLLKVWLNEAAKQGLISSKTYKSYRSKSVEVDNIYLTEEEIGKIYELDIPKLKRDGLVDSKSKMEESRDLFIVGCYTGLRQTDLSTLKNVLFDIKNDTIEILAHKTADRLTIPMHKYIKALCEKYEGKFPKMCDKSHYNQHLEELGRLAGINDVVMISENKGGVVRTTKFKKYQLISSHTARRSFATNLYLKGAPTISIMKLTGHKTEANFLKYIKVTREENAELMRKFFD